MAKCKVHKLIVPLDTDEGEIKTVTIRRPRVKDLRRLEAEMKEVEDDLTEGVVTLAVLTGLTRDQVEEMDVEDFTVLTELAVSFFPEAPGQDNGAA